ncbi:hypothetical protein ACFVUW_03475 [Streptomyces xiamenensis]|uniref:hypothetical protein n=1 Tax=Streptomyces xiamenensis TaxID=408015 RepID=UPI0036E601AB
MTIFDRYLVMLTRIPMAIRILALPFAVSGIYVLVRMSPLWKPYGIFVVIGLSSFLSASLAASRALEREAAAREKPGEENPGGR